MQVWHLRGNRHFSGPTLLGSVVIPLDELGPLFLHRVLQPWNEIILICKLHTSSFASMSLLLTEIPIDMFVCYFSFPSNFFFYPKSHNSRTLSADLRNPRKQILLDIFWTGFSSLISEVSRIIVSGENVSTTDGQSPPIQQYYVYQTNYWSNLVWPPLCLLLIL